MLKTRGNKGMSIVLRPLVKLCLPSNLAPLSRELDELADVQVAISVIVKYLHHLIDVHVAHRLTRARSGEDLSELLLVEHAISIGVEGVEGCRELLPTRRHHYENTAVYHWLAPWL